MAVRSYYTHIRGDDRKRVLKEIFQNNPQISDIRGLLTSRILDPILDSYPDMTVREFMELKHEELLFLRGFGRKSLCLVREFVKDLEENGAGKKEQPPQEYDESDIDLSGEPEPEEFTKNIVAKRRCRWSGYTKKDGTRVNGCLNEIPVNSSKGYCSRYCSLRMFCKYMAEEILWILRHLYGITNWEFPITIEQFARIILEKEDATRRGIAKSLSAICKDYNIDEKSAVIVLNHPIVRAKFPKVFVHPDALLDGANTIDNEMAGYMAKDKSRGVTHEQLAAAFGLPLYKVVQRLGGNDERGEEVTRKAAGNR